MYDLEQPINLLDETHYHRRLAEDPADSKSISTKDQDTTQGSTTGATAKDDGKKTDAKPA